MRVRRRAAAEESEIFEGRDRVPGIRRNQDAIARPNLARLSVDFHRTIALENKVKLFRQAVVVPFRRRACRQSRFSKALVLHRSIRWIQNAADGGTIFRRERFLIA